MLSMKTCFVNLGRVALRTVLTSAILPAAFAQTYTTFNVPGSISTQPTSINSLGNVTGNYLDSSGFTHGFLRIAGGTITTFDPPDSVETLPVGINSSDAIAGSYYTSTPATGLIEHGFLRASDGTITTITIPGSSSTGVSSINSAGDIAGEFSATSAPATFMAFLLTSGGTLTTYCNGIPVTGCSDSAVAAFINDTDTFAGSTYVAGFDGAASFVTPYGGTPATFTAPSELYTFVSGINDRGTVAGVANSAFCVYYVGCLLDWTTKAFVRTSDGRITVFQAGVGVPTTATGINASGEITGYYSSSRTYEISGQNHGFSRNASGVITSFDPPGSYGTTPTSINDSGVIAGFFDTAGACCALGFILTP